MRLTRRLLTAAIFVALLVGGWYFAALNSAAVVVHHPGGELAEVKLWVALLASFGLGVGISALIGGVRGARMRLVARRYRKLVDGLQAEIHQLRSLPLATDQAQPGDAGGAERGS